MNRKFFSLDIIKNSSTNRQIKSMQCTVIIDVDTLTALIGTTVILTARVDPPGIYDVNFRANGNLINPIPVTTDPNGIATLLLDTTGLIPGLYDLIAEVITPPPLACASSPLTVALTTTTCTGITIDTPGPITAYIGDTVSISATATVEEPSIIEFRETTLNMRVGSCTTLPTAGSCTASTDTTGSIPGTYSVVATVGNGTVQQCASYPIGVTLQERPGKIAIVGIPPGGRIYYDGNDTGMNTSAIIADVVPNIPHSIRVTLSGYRDYDPGPITVIPGGIEPVYTIMVPITPPTGVGNLNVTSTPDGVEFGLYTGEVNIAPVTLYDIPAGINAYESGLTGYNGAMGSVIIKSGETTNLNIPLQHYTSDMGAVIIESIPMEADIYIDGSPINARTSFMTLMPPGLHTYELRLSGYQNKSGSFTVVTGYDVPAIVSDILQPVSGTGMAVILIGGAAIGMMLMPKK